MKRSIPKTGSFLKIPLPDGTFAYGRVVADSHVAFYACRTTEPSTDLDTIASRPVLFRLGVRTIGLKKWEVIGTRKLEGEIAAPPVYFIQDIQDYRKCVIFDISGNEREATPEECMGLERAAAWETDGIERRLIDTFLGRPNAEEESLKVHLK